MFARNLRPSNYEDAIRKQEIVLSMLNKTKILLYLFLIDHFLINGINCAESLNIDLVGNEFEDLMIKEHNEQSNTGEKTSKPKETKTTNLENPEEKYKSAFRINFSYSTLETDNLSLKTKLLEGKIVELNEKQRILQNTTIPNLLKTCEELKELCIKINNCSE